MRTALHRRSDRGFTLIELLVVVIIIGILAAIAIPVFIGQQNQAHDSAAKSDLVNGKKAFVAFIGTASPDVVYDTQESLNEFGMVTSDGTTGLAIFFPNSPISNSIFCIQETSASGAPFHITESGGVENGLCGGAYPFEVWAYDYDA